VIILWRIEKQKEAVISKFGSKGRGGKHRRRLSWGGVGHGVMWIQRGGLGRKRRENRGWFNKL